jgi:hypothetical protein
MYCAANPVRWFIRSLIHLTLLAVIGQLITIPDASAAGYLPPATKLPLTLKSGNTVSTYGITPMPTFSQNISDNGLAIGSIKFDYETWSGTNSTGGFIGGGALSGGFFASNSVTVPKGDTVNWIQVVTTNVPGAGDVWGATANQPYPDTGKQAANPNYPSQSIATGVPTPQPSAGFQDFPSRAPQTNLVVKWQAELGLAIEDPTTHVATILGTFTWGFIEQAVAPAKATIANIIAIQPYSSNQGAGGPMTPPSTGFMSTLTTDYDGNKHGTVTSTKWTFNTPGAAGSISFAAVPEPSSWLMGISAVAIVAGWQCARRRSSARSALGGTPGPSRRHE